MHLPDVAGLSLLDAALAYADAGISVFPLAQRTKRPIHMGGFNQATTDQDQIRAWWGANPQANIGAVPGRSGCIVPDIDTVEARHAWFERTVVETASTQTGGGVGVHPWYLSETLARRSHWRLDENGGPFEDERLANLLFRASGGYVVVAPSIHPDTGQPYRLTNPKTPVSALPSDIERALLQIPARDAGGGHQVSQADAQTWFDDNSKPVTSPGGLTIVKQRLKAIQDSPRDARNDTLMAEVGTLLNAAYQWDINLHEAREAIREVYVEHVADTRRAAQANREVDHAFDYIATQRHWEGPLEEAIGGLPIKLESLGLPKPITPEQREELIVDEVIGGRLPIRALVSGDLPEIDYMVDGVIPRGRLVALVAEAKSGKSLFLLDMAASLAVGNNFLGKTHGTYTVLYIDYEMVMEDVSSRLINMGYGEDEATIGLLEQNLHYWQIPPIDPLDTEEGGKLLVRAAEKVGADLVIVDTLAAAVSGAENDADTFRAARQHTWAPLKSRGITIVRADHLGKDKARLARGSSMKRDDVDVNWLLTAHGGDRLRLKWTHSRLPGIQQVIDLERKSGPLRHVRTGSHIWAISAVSLAQAIVAAGINVDEGGRLDRKIRHAGISFDQKDLAEARRYIEEGMPPLDEDMKTDVQDPREGDAGPTPQAPSPPSRGRRKLPPIDQVEVT